MKSLYLRIWLTVVAALALFALATGWMWQRHLQQERARFESIASERLAAWGDLVQRSLPPAEAPAAEQAEALVEWALRLRLPLALDDAQGQRIGASPSYLRREAEGGPPPVAVRLQDGRTLWVARRLFRRGPGAADPGGIVLPPGLAGSQARRPNDGAPWRADGARPNWQGRPPGPPDGGGIAAMREPGLPVPPLIGVVSSQPWWPAVLLLLLLLAVAAGAYPVVRRLTRRLESLKHGVEAFGGGQLGLRVDDSGRDEVAAVATTFNRAADRIETLVRSHQSLLANASHELRSPLARLKMAVAMFADAGEAQRAALRREIDANVAELDALVEEVLLASRLDATQTVERADRVDLLGIAAEEAARVGAQAGGDAVVITGSERLLRRALRNLLENARRYGVDDVRAEVQRRPDGGARVRVCDRGPGVPEAYRERIFEPFFRLPGHAEREGGVGLGLSLVKQIAERHHGAVRCEPQHGGGSCFTLELPAAS